MPKTSEEEKLFQRKLRVMWLKDILTLYQNEDNGVKTIRAWQLKEMIRNAEADVIALTEGEESAEHHRKIVPEF